MTHFAVTKRFTLLSLLFALLFLAAGAQADVRLSAAIDMDTDQTALVKSFGWGEDLFVNISLTNEGDKDA